MRRLTLGLLLGVLLAVPATLVAAPPKATTVVTPMRENLDANGYSILNANEVRTTGTIGTQGNLESSSYVVADKLVSTSGEAILEPVDTSVISVSSGQFDPAVQGLARNTGSVYLRGAPHSGVYVHTGTDPHDWTCIGGCT